MRPGRSVLPRLFLTLLVCLACVAGCSKPERARVLTTAFPIHDLVRKVAGPDADVILLRRPGKEQENARDVSSAQLAMMVGLGLDDSMSQIVKETASKARVVKLGDRVPTLEEGSAIDPHVWMDPARARLIVKVIGEELARTDRQHAGAYRQRATEADAVLEALDKEVEAKASTWTKREFITESKSFGYFADRYQLKISPAGVKISAEQLDPVGGRPATDSYEKMIRFNVARFETALR